MYAPLSPFDPHKKLLNSLTGLTTSVYQTIVTPTERPKSVRNRCVIEVFRGVCVLSRCFLGFSLDVGDFVIGLSQISSFVSPYIDNKPTATPRGNVIKWIHKNHR